MARSDLEPPPSKAELVAKQRPDATWKTWLNKLYLEVKRLVAEEVQKTAFGEQSVAESTPVVNLQFAYNINPQLVNTNLNNGTVSVANSLVTLSTGAAAGQSAQLLSKIPVKYYTGLGGLIRHTTIFSTGVAGSTQIHGIGDSGDGYFFGYNGADFGVLRRYGGITEIRVLTITTASTTAENITITLDGDAETTVAVTNTGDVTLTANEIAAHDFSNVGRGWSTSALNDTVKFRSFTSAPRTGTYSLSSATTAVGTFAQEIAGVAPTDDWTLQANWSEDTRSDLDPTKGSPYQIRYQWLGFGQVCFYIEKPSTGKLELVHRIQYANENVLPSVQNPTLPLCMMIENETGGNTTDLTMSTASMAGFVEGKQPDPLVFHTEIVDKTFTNTTQTPIISGHNNEIFQSNVNRVRVKLESISVSVESGKPVIIELFKNATLTGASFADHGATESVVKVDTTATAVTGGEPLDAFSIASGDEKTRFFNAYLEVGEFMTIAGAQATTGTNSVTKIIVHWSEDF